MICIIKKDIAMEGVEPVSCGDRLYYREEDLKNIDKAYFYGCSRARSMIEKKDMKANDYIFAMCHKKTGVWEIRNRDYKPARLLVSKTWADHYVPALRPLDGTVDKDLKTYEDVQVSCQMAPPLLELEDHEKFRDKEGNVLEIEVRGERHHKKCYFLVRDVSDKFDLPNLRKSVTDDRMSYMKGLDYDYFICSNAGTNGIRMNTKMLFLTYEGLLKTLYISRSTKAQYFREWATEKLFTIQMGEEEDRDELAGRLIGVSAKTIHEVFRKNTEKTPCIYLFKIGDAAQMFPDGGYDKDDIICKYGFTDDLPRRTKEHNAYFGKQKNPHLGKNPNKEASIC